MRSSHDIDWLAWELLFGDRQATCKQWRAAGKNLTPIIGSHLQEHPICHPVKEMLVRVHVLSCNTVHRISFEVTRLATGAYAHLEASYEVADRLRCIALFWPNASAWTRIFLRTCMPLSS